MVIGISQIGIDVDPVELVDISAYFTTDIAAGATQEIIVVALGVYTFTAIVLGAVDNSLHAQRTFQVVHSGKSLVVTCASRKIEVEQLGFTHTRSILGQSVLQRHDGLVRCTGNEDRFLFLVVIKTGRSTQRPMFFDLSVQTEKSLNIIDIVFGLYRIDNSRGIGYGIIGDDFTVFVANRRIFGQKLVFIVFFKRREQRSFTQSREERIGLIRESLLLQIAVDVSQRQS